ncbi:hypothetical protein [Euzebya sp.]|uniref:hypothetical protein n=1 Tax=Euzebya sp. TaxID=1971409 RepID=UPI003511A7C6
MPERADIADWITEHLPRGWFEDVEVRCDKDEILVVGRLKPVADEPDGACIARFRETTRERRMQIASAAERRFGRKVSWGAVCGPTEHLFTTLSVPAMTRLRLDERRVLDTLIDAGVARSRSDALAWCVRLVAANEEEWLSELRVAFEAVERVRAAGPAGNPPAEG